MLSERFVPLDLADALQMAFTFAVETAVGDDEALAQEAGENVAGQRRQGYDLVARSARMARETLRVTSQGARWARASEIAGIEASPLTGDRFSQHFGRLLPLIGRVLPQDQAPGRMPKASLASNRVGAANTDTLEMAMQDLEGLEERVRADVARLDWTQQLAARHDRRAGTTNWGRVLLRGLAKKASALAHKVKHSPRANRTSAGIAANSGILVANMLRRLSA